MASIWETLISDQSYSELIKVMRGVGFEYSLESSSILFTVFAPRNEAFIKLADDFISSSELGMRTLAILNYHVIPDKLLIADILMHTDLSTLQGDRLKISVHDALYIDHAKLITPNILCDNGVIHTIDAVLIPPKRII